MGNFILLGLRCRLWGSVYRSLEKYPCHERGVYARSFPGTPKT